MIHSGTLSTVPCMRRVPLLLLLVCPAGCGRATPPAADSTAVVRDTLTRHQKDSILGQSELPGARVVAGAVRAQDSGAAHQRAVDSIANEP